MHPQRCPWIICLFCAVVTALPGGRAFALAPGLAGQSNSGPQAFAAGPQNKSSAALTSFAIVSIVPVSKDRKNSGWGYNYRDDGFFGKGISPYQLIQEAYDLYDEERILDVPQWARSAQFDIGAKVDPSEMQQFRNMTNDQRRAMLRTMLGPRFKLVTHYEKRVFPVYDLVVAKKGIKMSPSTSTPARSMNADQGVVIGSRPGYLRVTDLSMEALSSQLKFAAGRQVLDRTGLIGRYEFTLRWSSGLDASLDPMRPGHAPTLETDGPSIFAAIQEQLGLQLEPAKAELNVLVIDHVDPPTPN